MLVCDYLKFTFKYERLSTALRNCIEKRIFKLHEDDTEYRLTDFDVFLEVFPEIKKHMEDFYVVDSARYYKRRHAFNDSCYIYDDDGFNGQRGVNVEFPSHGLYLIKEWFNLEGDNDYFRSFLRILFKRGCTISRLDICHDVPIDKNPITPIKFMYWLSCNQIKSHYRCLRACGSNTKDFLIQTLMNGEGGATFYLGDRRHQVLRVYDKNVESKGENPSIRYEIEMHREKAMAVAEEYIVSDFHFGSVLTDMLDIIAYNNPNDRSRVPRDKEWEDFLNQEFREQSGVVVFPKKSVPPSLYARKAWAYRIYNSLLELQYIDPAFRQQLLDLKNSYQPSEQAISYKKYLASLV